MSKLQEGNCALEANEQRQLPIYRTHTNGELEEVSMIKRFDKVDGSYVEKIYGQDRYGYSKSDTIAYSARTAHPFQRNGAPFRFKLSKTQQVD